MSEPEDLLTVDEVAALLRLNPQTIRNWIDRDELPAARVGRRVRIRRVDVEAKLGTPLQRAPAPTMLFVVIVYAGINPREYRKSVGPFESEEDALAWVETKALGLAPSNTDWCSVMPLMKP